jgi:hypothetical protein
MGQFSTKNFGLPEGLHSILRDPYPHWNLRAMTAPALVDYVRDWNSVVTETEASAAALGKQPGTRAGEK